MSVEWKRPSGGRVLLVMAVLALLSWMAVASFGNNVAGWASVGALAGGAICSACGVDSTKGWRELSVAAALSSVLAVAMVLLHRAMQ